MILHPELESHNNTQLLNKQKAMIFHSAFSNFQKISNFSEAISSHFRSYQNIEKDFEIFLSLFEITLENQIKTPL
jgi:hypothetical protein